MEFKLSKNAEKINPSVTLEITAKAQEMKSRGIDVIGFGAGEPDYSTPKNIIERSIEAVKTGHTKYTPASGVLELKKAICIKLERENNLKYSPENIIVSNGAKHSLYNVFLTILNSGDEVIISNPYWVSYPEIVSLAGGVPVFCNVQEENYFRYDIEDLKSIITKKTKAIIINSPNNPTGTIYEKEDLEAIAKLADENNLIIISDEIYEKLIYDGKHISIASLNEKTKERTLVINGMSKAYSMTGWRIGYAAGNRDIIKTMSNIQSHTTSNPNSIAQEASIEALLGDQSEVEIMKKNFKERRDYIVGRINDVPGISCLNPKGAFYVMVNISKLKGKVIQGVTIENSLDFSKLLLEKANVAVVPGIAFGSDDFIRLSYAISMESITKGLDRIEKTLK